MVGEYLHCFSGARKIIDEPGFDVRLDDLSLIVGAFVVVNVKVVDARRQMIIEPLFDVRAFAFHNGNDRQVMQK